MRYITFFILCFMLLGCSETEIIHECEAPIEGKWNLVKIRGSVSGHELTGEDIPYEEYYIFDANGSFSKTRISSEGTESISGTYTNEVIENWEYLKLVYTEDSILIENCSGELIEELAIHPNELRGGSAPCDGPALFYAPEGYN